MDTNKEYKLSIITINYNDSIGLEKTFRSVFNQNYRDFEYIVVDGNSTDNSKQIIEQYSNQIHTWISEPDSGVYNAMNKGIEIANGTYLLFLNSGDQLANKEVLENVIPLLDETEIIYGNLIYSKKGIPDNVFVPPSKISLTYFINFFLPHPSTFIKKSVFSKVGFYTEKFKIISDWEFFLKAIIVNKASYKHIDYIITDFDNSGISSNSENEKLISQEKKNAYEILFPSLQEEIDLLKIASSRRFSQIQQIQKHPFLWKLLKGFLNVLNVFVPTKEEKFFRKIE